MRLVTWRRAQRTLDQPADQQRPRIGLLVGASPECAGGSVLPLDVVPGLGDDRGLARALEDGDLASLLAADPALALTRFALDRLGPAAAAERALARDAVRLLAPVPRPAKVVCVGLNYRDHVAEQGIATPDRPTLFSKFANAVVAGGEPVILPDVTHALDLEAELAFVIGRLARHVPAAEAMAVVAGYCAANDVSARDLQGQRAALGPGEHGDGQWLRAKGSDTFLPLGPALVTVDEVSDPPRLPVRSWVTIAARQVPAERPRAPFQMQDGNTENLVFDIPDLVEFISAVITLDPGDVVITGTPAGVGIFRDPPILLAPGDVVSVEVGGIGRLTNPVVASDGTAPAGSPAALFLDEAR